jgi:hypothetical protein
MDISGWGGMPGTIITLTMVDITGTIQATDIPRTGLCTITSIGPLMSVDPYMDRTGSHTEKVWVLMYIAQDRIDVTYQIGISNDQEKALVQDRKIWLVMQGRSRQEWNRIGGERRRLQIDQWVGTIVEGQKTMSLPTGMETSIVRLRRVGSSEPREVGSDLKKRDKDPGILSSNVQV